MYHRNQPYTHRADRQPQDLPRHDRTRPPREPNIEYLDRWSPLEDRAHYRRVDLWRRRKQSAAAVQSRKRKCRKDLALRRAKYVAPPKKEKDYLASVNDGTDTSLSSSEEEGEITETTESGLSSSELGSTFQEELDDYDVKIQALQENEWLAPPEARAPAVRVSRLEFSQQRARELKSWSLAQGLMYGQQSATLRNTDKVHDADRYSVGVIFSAPYHVPSGGDERWVSVTDPHNTATPYGVVHSKYRKMIVIKAFAEHCVCVPVYSHSGCGLERKDSVVSDEYVSIRDVADPNPEPSESPHPPLLAVGDREFRGTIIAGKSNVKLSEFCSHQYNVPATIEGWLDSKSLSKQRLLELVMLVSM
jgi:hypothetical protein